MGENRGDGQGRSIRCDEPIDCRDRLIFQLHHGLRHGRVPGVTRLANLIGACFGVPVRGYVETQRTYRQRQNDCDKCCPSLRRHRSNHRPRYCLSAMPI